MAFLQGAEISAVHHAERFETIAAVRLEWMVCMRFGIRCLVGEGMHCHIELSDYGLMPDDRSTALSLFKMRDGGSRRYLPKRLGTVAGPPSLTAKSPRAGNGAALF